jgi:hypothetical protein
VLIMNGRGFSNAGVSMSSGRGVSANSSSSGSSSGADSTVDIEGETDNDGVKRDWRFAIAPKETPSNSMLVQHKQETEWLTVFSFNA